MRSWTRTLNFDDAHRLLALAVPGTPRADWESAARTSIVEHADHDMTGQRVTGLVRLVREIYLTWTDDYRIEDSLFLRMYRAASVVAQEELVRLRWAFSHPITDLALSRLVRPALHSQQHEIPLEQVDLLVESALDTTAPDALRKTRTVLMGALEGIGVVQSSGTGRHRAFQAIRSALHPTTIVYLLLQQSELHGIPLHQEISQLDLTQLVLGFQVGLDPAPAPAPPRDAWVDWTEVGSAP